MNPRFQVARYTLAPGARPLLADTVTFAESARSALMSIFGRQEQSSGVRPFSPLFAGKDNEGKPLENHRHAYYLPTDEDCDGVLDHLTLFAAAGFGAEEFRTISSLTWIKWVGGNGGPVRFHLSLQGIGRLNEYRPFPFSPSQVWISATPFVAPRFPKLSGAKADPLQIRQDPVAFLSHMLRGELESRSEHLKDTLSNVIPCLDAELHFRLPDSTGIPSGLRPTEFRRFRSKQSDDGGRRLCGYFRIEFTEPVGGPICLGHSSHFGLGLFVPLSAPRSAVLES